MSKFDMTLIKHSPFNQLTDLLQKLAMVLELKRVMRFPSSIEVVDIWTIAGSLSDTLSAGSHWLSLVIPGYPWLPYDYII